MAAIARENLDERIERIKKRNEEIEKKHREAEEDRLMALKDNAMVETKPPKDEDWPKGHKYDKLDFTYDVKPEKLEEIKQRKQEDVKSKRDYKKFADGEGPPPDPAYNFLADAERDGVINVKNENRGEKKDYKQNNKNKDSNNKRNGPNNNSFRGRGGKLHNSKYQKQNSQPEYEQWRSEREKIDEARINRQKIGDGKWRREWDNDKINGENEALLKPERITLGDTINTSIKKSPVHSGKNNSHYSGHNITSDCLIEKRGNITVSVSQTGEVKSVKLTSAPVIGTGRVGPRQVSKPQFSVQTIDEPIPSSPKLHIKEHQKNFNISQNSQQKFHAHNNHNVQHKSTQNSNVHSNMKNQHKPSAPLNTSQKAPTTPPNAVICPPSPIKNKRKPQNTKFTHTQNVVTPDQEIIENPFIAELPIPGANGIVPIDLSHKPEFAKKSVQDRLLRVRQTNQNENEKPSADKIDLKTCLGDTKEEKLEDLENKCDKAKEDIQPTEPIAACN